MSTDTGDASTDSRRDVFDSVREALDAISDSADVRRVYGEPVTVDGRTLVPVARVAYAVGGGFGSATGTESGDSEGGGGGAAVLARPVGVVEVADGTTRFLRVSTWRRVALAAGLGAATGWLLGRR